MLSISSVFVQGTEPLTLTHLGTHPTGLQYGWAMAVMPSGKVVVFARGKNTGDDSSEDSSNEPYGFHIYSGSAEDWRKLKQLPRLCEHGFGGMSPVSIGNQELLAVSCRVCAVIRLLNLEMGESSTAFRDPWYNPKYMWEGEEGQMFVTCMNGVILQLKCSSQTFKIVKQFETEIAGPICYVPQHKLLVGVRFDDTVIGVDSETGKLQWELQWESKWFDGLIRILYSPESDALLIDSSLDTQLLVVNASDGEVRQELQLLGEVGWVWNMRLHDGQLVLLRGIPERKVSFFSLQ